MGEGESERERAHGRRQEGPATPRGRTEPPPPPPWSDSSPRDSALFRDGACWEAASPPLPPGQSQERTGAFGRRLARGAFSGHSRPRRGRILPGAQRETPEWDSRRSREAAHASCTSRPRPGPPALRRACSLRRERTPSASPGSLRPAAPPSPPALRATVGMLRDRGSLRPRGPALLGGSGEAWAGARPPPPPASSIRRQVREEPLPVRPSVRPCGRVLGAGRRRGAGPSGAASERSEAVPGGARSALAKSVYKRRVAFEAGLGAERPRGVLVRADLEGGVLPCPAPVGWLASRREQGVA